jgi:peptidoglycan/xylan/chitin deacetylase (PgdA/CDA1 family)
MTADVHHNLGDAAEKFSKYEHIHTEEYQQILENYGGTATYFVTGKCIDENIEFWKEFIKKEIELGGHTYWAFRPRIVLRINMKLFRSLYGGKFYKKLDISKSIKAFKKLNINMKIWRTHTYLRDDYVYNTLKENGIKIISDMKRNDLELYNIDNLIHVPMTCLTDDKIHALHCTGDDRIEIHYEWKRIRDDILSKINLNKDLVILLHPSTMKLLDKFKSFEDIVKLLLDRNYRFVNMSTLVKEKFDEIII